MRARLRQLGAAIYGTKDELYLRIVSAERQRRRDEQIAKATEDRRRDLQAAQAPAVPRGLTGPREPTQEEREQRSLTHLPYQSWCSFCVLSKTRADPHQRIPWEDREDGPPQVQLDFMFLKASCELQDTPVDAWATTLCGVDVSTGAGFAVTLDHKGASNEYAHLACLGWISDTLRHRRVLIQTDG